MIEGVIRGKRLESVNVVQTHIAELKAFELLLDGKPLGKCNYFTGRGYYPPWIELDYDPWPRQLGLEAELFKFFFDILPDNGRFFITYYKDPRTFNAIIRGFSVADTELGRSLLIAGFTWFKNWYFPEGGNEGGMKIQANKTLSQETRRRQLSELLAEVKTPESNRLLVELLAQGKS
ncbi:MULTISPECIES: DUF1122 family protein [Metallosphaera]|uniref:Uncharacterized conserved protein UCP017998 n=3 Tax=Metallosphaera TaxID=41980 RepID=A4YIP5_METS5|nr:MULTISPECIES: DUF1122 family protein [Metallosphaera]ABP96297.1 uncharacterized conserved protein UCP017998 [Metallosphaera sedula DSM 5348]AIM28280.1 uncharacterized conserved protein UCP017998 [Metallosphaera sedula]AKV75083.1 hypothetical protein MsedA_2209 [Metallosphaera sedula]AKV77322.1 hypothetical protein MsedB_2211 [Metallosphaera sedula]AKV79572.1 hypothetical protein MsedC_2209 [Metallosphaera sedula]